MIPSVGGEGRGCGSGGGIIADDDCEAFVEGMDRIERFLR